MSFSIPNAVNYRSPLNAVPLDWISFPVEGAKGIQCSIAWGTDGGANNSVYVNCQNNATLNFSKIRALIIDNSQSGADISFIFPDTETTVSIPAYTPYAIVPVFTNQTQFYVTCPNAQPEDVTNFTILNTAPPPVAVPTTQEQNFYNNGQLNASAASGTIALVPSTIDGTLEALAITAYGLGSTATTTTVFQIIDGLGHSIWQGIIIVPTSTSVNELLIALSELRVRFQQGLSLHWTTTGSPLPSLFAAVNLYYRNP